MELRYMPTSADVLVGDLLYTSGLDEVYPSGFQVAKVTEVTRESANSFASIIAEPTTSVETRNAVMILNVPQSLPQRAEEEADEPSPRKGRRR
jgi:rod shape-determining protein MreC